MVEFKNVSKFYGEIQALDGVSFQIPEAQIVGLLGKNGAGKSTCMKILAGVLKPSSGEYHFAGQCVDMHKDPSWKKEIGFLPDQAPVYEDLSVFDNLMFWASLKGLNPKDSIKKINQALDRCGLQSHRKRYGGSLSKGYRQRLGLAQAILSEPRFLILDEPGSGLDPQQNQEMRSLIKDLGRDHSILFSSHHLHEVELLCSKVIVLQNSRLTAFKDLKEPSSHQEINTLEIKFLSAMTTEQKKVFEKMGNIIAWGESSLEISMEKNHEKLVELQKVCAQNSIVISQMNWKEESLEQKLLRWMESENASNS